MDTLTQAIKRRMKRSSSVAEHSLVTDHSALGPALSSSPSPPIPVSTSAGASGPPVVSGLTPLPVVAPIPAVASTGTATRTTSTATSTELSTSNYPSETPTFDSTVLASPERPSNQPVNPAINGSPLDRASKRLSNLFSHLPGHSSPVAQPVPVTATAHDYAAPLDSPRRDHRSVLGRLPSNRRPSPFRAVRDILNQLHSPPMVDSENDFSSSWNSEDGADPAAPTPTPGAKALATRHYHQATNSTIKPTTLKSGIVADDLESDSVDKAAHDRRTAGRAIRKGRHEEKRAKNQLKKDTRTDLLKKKQAEREAERAKRRHGMSVERTTPDGHVSLLLRTLPVNNYAAAEYEVGSDSDSVVNISTLGLDYVGQHVHFRARVHTVRRISKDLQFVVLRQDSNTIQAVLRITPLQASHTPEAGTEVIPTTASIPTDSIQHQVVAWSRIFLTPETIVELAGTVVEPASKTGQVNTTVKMVEIAVCEIAVVSHVERVPFSVNQAEKSNKWRRAEEKKDGKKKRVDGIDAITHNLQTDAHKKTRGLPQASVTTDRVRAENRVLDLRTEAGRAIFRIQSTISHNFRSYLHSHDFIEIHTPKLQGAATESGSSVFRVDYFGRPAFLAQSPQLAKQLAIASDMKRVFEVGPVFRAENSNTHRHLTEFTGLDLEMEIKHHYHEVLDVIDETFKAIFAGVYTDCRPEITAIKKRYPHEDLIWLEVTPRLRFDECIQMLNDSGWRSEEGELLKKNEDLSTRDEIQLGKVIKAKYHTDYYIIDKFPIEARPFYAMPDPEDPTVTNSFDIFLRGQEILSGGQRIHDPHMLRKRMAEHMIGSDGGMAEYMTGFDFGAPPHGGGGIGLERMLFLLLGLDDIRRGTMFARDPRSFPLKLTDIPDLLRYPQADTRNPTSGREEVVQLPSLEMMIANYGDAANTSWLEPRTVIWRHLPTGAAVGFVPLEGYAIIAGNPLCHESQYVVVSSAFLDHITSLNLKPIWLLVNGEMEVALASRNWRSLSVTAEQRLDPTDPVRLHNKHVMSKVQRSVGKIKFVDYDFGVELPAPIKAQLDSRVQDWHKSREGKKQVHLTDIRTDQDLAHRSTHLAFSIPEPGSTTGPVLMGMVMLAQLAPRHGVQVKYSLDFPGAPSGSIEALLVHTFEFVARNQERITLASATARAIDAARASKSHTNHDPSKHDPRDPKVGAATANHTTTATHRRPVHHPSSSNTAALSSMNLCVTFGSGATSRLETGNNISFARSIFLEMMYNNIVKAAGLTNKSVFRRKLGTVEDPTWLCYPHKGLSYPVLLKFFGYEWEWAGKASKMEFSLKKGLRRKE